MRELITNSLTDPARAAVDLLRMNFTIPVLLQAAIAVTALTTLLGLLTVTASGGPADLISAAMSSSPLSFAIMQFGMFLFMSGMIFLGGRAFGGIGSLQGSLLVGVWIGVMQLIIQVAQFLVLSLLVFMVSVFLAAIGLAMTGSIPEELLKEMSRVAET